MKNAVVDTNVFVSALLGSTTCKKIYELLKADVFLLMVSDDLLNELKSTLIRAKFELSKEEIEDTIEHI